MFEITLTDTTATLTLPDLNPSLDVVPLEGAADVETLNMSLFTDFTAKKRRWVHTWGYMDESDFDALEGFYNRQFSTGDYPTVTITRLGVSNVPARLGAITRSVIDNCGQVRNVSITLREA